MDVFVVQSQRETSTIRVLTEVPDDIFSLYIHMIPFYFYTVELRILNTEHQIQA